MAAITQTICSGEMTMTFAQQHTRIREQTMAAIFERFLHPKAADTSPAWDDMMPARRLQASTVTG